VPPPSPSLIDSIPLLPSPPCRYGATQLSPNPASNTDGTVISVQAEGVASTDKPEYDDLELILVHSYQARVWYSEYEKDFAQKVDDL